MRLPGQVEGEHVGLQEALLHHSVHDGSLLTHCKRGVRQTQDPVEVGHQEGPARLIKAHTYFLVLDNNTSNLQREQEQDMPPQGSVSNKYFQRLQSCERDRLVRLDRYHPDLRGSLTGSVRVSCY